MTKPEYMTAIETSLTTAEALCADLRKLRTLKKLAKEIPGSDAMVSFDVLDKAVEEKEVSLKTTRAELNKARRIVKKFNAIEAMENEGQEAPATDAQDEKPKKKSTAKKPKVAKVEAADKESTPAEGTSAA